MDLSMKHCRYASYSTEIICQFSAGNMFFMWYIAKINFIKRDGISPPLEKPQRHAEQNVMKHLYSVCEGSFHRPVASIQNKKPTDRRK